MDSKTTHPALPFRFGKVTQGFLALAAGTVVGLLVLGWIATLLLPASGRALFDSVGFGVQAPDDAKLATLSQSSSVFAADGQLVSELHDEENRIVVPLAEIPPVVQNAILAAEDRKFWSHPGYDVEGIGRAAVGNIRRGGVSQGGSTITQQLAKSEVGTEATFQRKLAEVAFAVALERDLTKEQILERYLNQVYFGGGAYGIEAAALEYYGVKANQLRVDQAATLAGQIRSPGKDARKSPEVAKRRRDEILHQLLAVNQLTQEEHDQAIAQPIQV
ncbi:biosynthetic peptidoglycan transglycosylase, partial [Stomatohabitans albus]|uniref:transglycosylase domain-containing protein n=1 Tax=Stomatohabitans albus TaxID=3110766 RepID=UPI00300CDF93